MNIRIVPVHSVNFMRSQNVHETIIIIKNNVYRDNTILFTPEYTQ